MTAASAMHEPEKLWPPPRTDSSRPEVRANRMAAATSVALVQLAMIHGRRSWRTSVLVQAWS